jgi:hypothetical protein
MTGGRVERQGLSTPDRTRPGATINRNNPARARDIQEHA